jgi:hypothetical protein
LKKKLDLDFRRYKILGACNPPFAYHALQAKDKIGTMLPCNVIVQETTGGIEVALLDRLGARDEGDDFHLSPAAGTGERDLEHQPQELCPALLPPLGRRARSEILSSSLLASQASRT